MVEATAILSFLANSSRKSCPRRPIDGGRFVASYSHASNARRTARSLKRAGVIPSAHTTNVTYPSPVAAGEPLLRLSITGVPGGIDPPCTFTYGAGRTVVRLGRLNVTTALEGDWIGTTVAQVAPSGPFLLVSAGQCLPKSAGGPGLVLEDGAAPSVEACATQCVG